MFLNENPEKKQKRKAGGQGIPTSKLSKQKAYKFAVEAIGDKELHDEENDDDDEDKDEEGNEDPTGTSGHQGLDDDDNDDANLLGICPSRGASTYPPPPSTSHTDPPISTRIDDHPHDTRAAGGQQDTIALVTYKKRSAAMVSSISKETTISIDLVPSTSKEMAIVTIVSSTGVEIIKSTAMVLSSKEKEKAILGNTDSFNVANPWLYKEFCLAKQLQLKEYLQADDMYSDMKRLAHLYSGVRNSIRDGLSHLKLAQDNWDHKLQRILDFSTSSSTLSHKPMTIEYQEKNINNMIHIIRVFKRMLSQENDILINCFELMLGPPALLYVMRMEEAKLLRFYPALYPPHTEPADQLTYIQIVEQIGDWWEKAEGLWKEWITVINEMEQKKIVKEFKTSVGKFKAGMRSWKYHMEIGEILFEARIKANQPEPVGWLATTSHYHKLARARVIKGKKTLYYPQTKEWLPMTPYEQQMLVKEPEVLEQIAVYKIIKKQTAAQEMEASTSTQRPVQPREKKPLDKDKGKRKK
ncbi:hypothetical protein L7F22_013904 [Adiantum nelumboides]|nr:hypothetical protein [Adiantum nelumboides]